MQCPPLEIGAARPILLAMNVSAIGLEASGAYLRDMVGMSVLSKSLKGTEERAAQLLKAMESPAPLPEGSGTVVDLYA